MSHVADMNLKIKNLDDLSRACQTLGLELVRDQKTYKWFGRWMNDYSGENAAYNHGIKPEDYGKCDHAIRIPGDSKAYEIGVVADGSGEYQLIWDFYGGGFGLVDKIGKTGGKLKQAYGVEAAMSEMYAKGWAPVRSTDEHGNMYVTYEY